jgi:hypothetical protein
MPPDFKLRSALHQETAGYAGAVALLERSEQWDLRHVLRTGGAVIFPHATLDVCGHHIAAAVRAALDSGADAVLALGVVHALTEELRAARRKAESAETDIPCRHVLSPQTSMADAELLRAEFSLSHFQFLWDAELRRRGIPPAQAPALHLLFPHLAMGHPETLPGFETAQRLLQEGCALAMTMDPMHHGIGYGDSPLTAMPLNPASAEKAALEIQNGLNILCSGDMLGYIQHCTTGRSDGRDTGQLAAALIHPCLATVHDVVLDDMTEPYESPAPTWVAGALCTLEK